MHRIERRFAKTIALEKNELESNPVRTDCERRQGAFGAVRIAQSPLDLVVADTTCFQMVDKCEFVVVEEMQCDGRVLIRRALEDGPNQPRLEGPQKIHGLDRGFETHALSRLARAGTEQGLTGAQGLVDFVVLRQ